MRVGPGLPLVLLAALATSTVAAQNPALRDNRALRSSIEVTTVTATVRDKEGRLVTGLDASAFDIREDGEPQQLTVFTRERVPISLGVVLDTSDSMFGRRLKDARAAVERFLFELLDPGDEYFALAFNHRPHWLTRWTSTPDVIRRALDRLQPTGGTAAYDAVVAALPMFVTRSRERGAILVISDGADTASTVTIRELRSALLRSDVFVYAIALDSPDRQAINTRVNPTALREITDDSGGRTEVVQSSADIAEATARIAEELNSQYVLGYTSSHRADGQYHSIRVRVQGTEYKVRARSGYVATPPR